LQLNKLHRIYINDNISINDELKINSDTSNHIKNVLRIRNNSKIVVFNGDGKEYIAEVNYTDNSTILIKHENPSRKDNTHQITLAQCIPSAKHMDLAIQKSVEIGINKIVPVISERSHPGDHKKKYSHWKNIIIHSTEQSNGLFLTELDEITDLEKFLINVSENASCKICFHMSGRKITKNDKSHQSHIILIGPEGGFSTKEIDLIERYNWNIVSLGDRILRTETAAIVAQTILRDF
tara:strand:- start:345 stop:1055 length:711 start_codon:yes stop_codon:yes gene_type:complete